MKIAISARGRLGCFSFFFMKNLEGSGDGGMVVTNDEAMAEKLSILRVHGSQPKYHQPFVGGNFRWDELQAAILNVKFLRLGGLNPGIPSHPVCGD